MSRNNGMSTFAVIAHILRAKSFIGFAWITIYLAGILTTGGRITLILCANIEVITGDWTATLANPVQTRFIQCTCACIAIVTTGSNNPGCPLVLVARQ